MLHTEEIMDKKLNKNKRLLSVAPMMDWTEEAVRTEGEGTRL
jgi:tRNA-dihydrouridine synthase